MSEEFFELRLRRRLDEMHVDSGVGRPAAIVGLSITVTAPSKAFLVAGRSRAKS